MKNFTSSFSNTNSSHPFFKRIAKIKKSSLQQLGLLTIKYSLVLLFMVLGTLAHAQDKTWDGSSSNDWNAAANWIPSGVPDADDDVLIPSGTPNQPVIEGITVYAKSVTVASGASLSIQYNSGDPSILNLAAIDTDALINEGTVTNGGIINISRYNSENNISGIRNNRGTFINQSTGAATSGLINIDDVDGSAIVNINGGLIENKNGGQMLIGQGAGNIGIWGIWTQASGQFINDNSLVKIDNTASHGCFMRGSSLIENKNGGEMLIGQGDGNIGGNGIYTVNSGSQFINDNSLVKIDNTAGAGCHLQNGHLMENKNGAEMLIGQGDGNIGTHGIWLRYNGSQFINDNSLLKIDNVNNHALLVTSTATMENKAQGEIWIGQIAGNIGGSAILNNVTFDNNGCGSLVHVFSDHIIENTGNFTNSGLIIDNASGNSSISTNNGVVINLNGGDFTCGGTAPIILDDIGDKLWTGCDSTTIWTEMDNWYPLEVPQSNELAVIASGPYQPIIASGSTVELSSLQLGEAASLEIEANATLTIEDSSADGLVNKGTLTNDGSMTTNADFEIQSGGTVQGNGLYIVKGDWINNGSFVPGTSTLSFNGTSVSSLQSSSIPEFHLLTINGAGLQLASSVQVNFWLRMNKGLLDLNGNHVELIGDGIIFNEKATHYIYDNTGTGYVMKTAEMNQPTSENLGNMGVEITSAANLGTVTIKRHHLTHTINGASSINRYYDISPTNNSALNAHVRFYYLDHEVSTTESELAPFRWDDPNWVHYHVSDSDASANWVETTNVDAFSLWTLGSNAGLLAVEWTSLSATAKADAVLLNWQTASEVDNQGFEVQHSQDAKQWKSLTFVAGKGNSSTAQHYEFLHESPNSGINYYRLKQVDFNGKYEYSDIVSVVLSTPKQQQLPQAFPNPFQADLSLINAQGVLRIYNAAGQQLHQLVISSQQQNLQTSDWPKGVYILKILKDNGQTAAIKVLK